MANRLAFIASGAASVLAMAGPATAAVGPCATSPTLTPVSDLEFGRLIVADRGGGVQLPASSCNVVGTDGVVQLSIVQPTCAEFDLNGGAGSAGRTVQLRVQAPRSFRFASGGGLAQVSQTSLAGGGAQGAGEFFVVRLGADGRAHLRLGATLRVVDFAPGEIAAPISLSAHFLGCPL